MDLRSSNNRLLALAVVVVAVWKYVQRRKYLREVEEKTGGIPGTLGWPGLGETIDFATNSRVFVEARARQHGKVFKTNLMGANMVYVTSPELAEHVYNSKDFGQGTFSTFIELFGDFLLVKNGKEHERPRRLITHALADSALKSNLPYFIKEISASVDRWRGRQVFIMAELKLMLIHVMSKILISDLPSALIETTSKDLDAFGKGFFAAPIKASFTEYGKALQARARLIKMIEGQVQKRRSDPAKYAGFTDVFQNYVSFVDPDTNAEHSASFIAQNVLVAIFGSVDTTASAMASCILLANQHPECLKRMAEEFRPFFGGDHPFSADSTTLDQLACLHYMNAFICEVMRVRSPFTAAFRQAVRDAPLPGTNFTVPEGWLVGISQDYAFRSSVKNFPEAAAFKPERFMPGGVSFTHSDFKHALYPFGKGAHIW